MLNCIRSWEVLRNAKRWTIKEQSWYHISRGDLLLCRDDYSSCSNDVCIKLFHNQLSSTSWLLVSPLFHFLLGLDGLGLTSFEANMFLLQWCRYQGGPLCRNLWAMRDVGRSECWCTQSARWTGLGVRKFLLLWNLLMPCKRKTTRLHQHILEYDASLWLLVVLLSLVSWTSHRNRRSYKPCRSPEWTPHSEIPPGVKSL